MTEIHYCEKYWISRNIAIASIPVFHYGNKVTRKCLFVYDATPMDGVSNKGVSNKGVNIMGREVRRVPANWDHWSYSDQPLFDNFRAKLARWVENVRIHLREIDIFPFSLSVGLDALVVG